MEPLIVGMEWHEKFDSFARGEPAGKDFMCAGLFFNRDERYQENMARFFHKLFRKEGDFEEFKRFLMDVKEGIEGEAIYPRDKVIRGGNLRGRNFSFPRFREGKSFPVERFRVGENASFGRESCAVFVKMGEEEGELSGERQWELRKKLLEIWRREEEGEAGAFLEKVRKVIALIEEFLPAGPWEFQTFSRLFFYLLPVNFDRLENSIFISSVSLFRREEKTREKLWENLQELMRKEHGSLWEDLEEFLAWKGEGIDFVKGVLEEALKEETLEKLRQSWVKLIRKILEGKVPEIAGQVLVREEGEGPWISYGEFFLPRGEMDLYLFYEEGIERELVEKLEGALKEFRYIPGLKVRVRGKFKLEELFGGKEFFEVIKGRWGKKGVLENEESIRLIYALSNFAVRMKSFMEKIWREGRMQGILLFLNTELEAEERYALWDYVRLIYGYYGLPVQTVTRRFVRELDDREDLKKNMFISLCKDQKELSFRFGGFTLPPQATVYVILEKPSHRFFYRKGERERGYYHSLCEVYRVEIRGGEGVVRVKDKFVVFGNGYGGERERLEGLIREEVGHGTCFCFISSVKDSFLQDLYSKYRDSDRFFFIGYRELKTAYFPDDKRGSCQIIHARDFEELMKKFGIDLEAMGIKPLDPLWEREFYHPSFQIFSPREGGWGDGDLLLLVFISLSMFESEAALAPYARLELQSREGKSFYIKIKREDERRTQRDYIFPLSAAIYEMLGFMRFLTSPW